MPLPPDLPNIEYTTDLENLMPLSSVENIPPQHVEVQNYSLMGNDGDEKQDLITQILNNEFQPDPIEEQNEASPQDQNRDRDQEVPPNADEKKHQLFERVSTLIKAQDKIFDDLNIIKRSPCTN